MYAMLDHYRQVEHDRLSDCITLLLLSLCCCRCAAVVVLLSLCCCRRVWVGEKMEISASSPSRHLDLCITISLIITSNGFNEIKGMTQSGNERMQENRGNEEEEEAATATIFESSNLNRFF